MNMKIQESPNAIQLQGTIFSHADPKAIGFIVVGSNVIYGPVNHPLFFNLLSPEPDQLERLQSGDTVTPKMVEKRFKEASIKTSEPISQETLALFAKLYSPRMGVARVNTCAGRVWRNISLGGRKLSAIAFWGTKARVPNDKVQLVIAATKLQGEIIVEYADSKKPFAWSRPNSNQSNNLSAKEIGKLQMKAHKQGTELSTGERSQLRQLRGTGPTKDLGVKQANTFGDSLSPKEFVKKLLS